MSSPPPGKGKNRYAGFRRLTSGRRRTGNLHTIECHRQYKALSKLGATLGINTRPGFREYPGRVPLIPRRGTCNTPPGFTALRRQADVQPEHSKHRKAGSGDALLHGALRAYYAFIVMREQQESGQADSAREQLPALARQRQHGVRRADRPPEYARAAGGMTAPSPPGGR
jgi:hypothetical protein